MSNLRKNVCKFWFFISGIIMTSTPACSLSSAFILFCIADYVCCQDNLLILFDFQIACNIIWHYNVFIMWSLHISLDLPHNEEKNPSECFYYFISHSDHINLKIERFRKRKINVPNCRTPNKDIYIRQGLIRSDKGNCIFLSFILLANFSIWLCS